jgi:hypothetical protein
MKGTITLPASQERASSEGAWSRGKRMCLFVVSIAIFLFISSATASAHITQLIPSSTAAGGPDFTLRILGSDLDDSDTTRVSFDGTRVAATLFTAVGPGGAGPPELHATIPASLITKPGIVKVALEGFNSVDFTILSAGCAFSVSPAQFVLKGRSTYEGLRIDIDGQPGCTWEVIIDEPWMRLRSGYPKAGVGSGETAFDVDQNRGSFRSGVIDVAGKQLVVYQDSADTEPCFAIFCYFFPRVCSIVPHPGSPLSVARGFRDQVLAQSPRGRLYTQLYYEFSSEAVSIAMLNPSLILRSREILERYKPVLESMIKGEQVSVTEGDIEEIEGFLNSFTQKASAELRQSLKGLCEDLRDPQVHSQFNITVTKGPKRELPARDAVESIKQTGMMITPMGLLLLSIYAVRPRRKKTKAALRRMYSVAIALSVVSSPWLAVSGQSSSSCRRTVLSGQPKEKGARPPCIFEANQGQLAPQVKFISRDSGYNLFLTPTEAVMSFRRQKTNGKKQEWEVPQPTADQEPSANDVLTMKLSGANPGPKITGLERQPSVSNYFIGNDPVRWRTNVPGYAKVKYENVYPGVDMTYYGNQQNLEYDFIVAPGADPAQIRLGFEGADEIGIDSQGDLVLHTAGGEVRQREPIVYQEQNGKRSEISGRYALIQNPKYKIRDWEVGLEIGAYDRSRPLIIDPVLAYSTYFGGGGNEEGNSITVDSTGNVYLTGFTDSINFPLANPSQPNLGDGPQDAFVVKLDPSGTRLLYSTYLGGNGQDNGTSIAVDQAGNAYIAGFTDSTNFPVRNALQTTNRGSFNAFVVKLDPAGSILNSTLFGGTIGDYASSIAVDAAGSVYVAGIATSPDLPMAGAIQPQTGGLVDAYVVKIDPSGNRLVYSTYLGGLGIEGASSIAVDSAGNVYLTGLTSSPNFRTVNALQAAHGGGLFDAFVAKLNPSGTQLVYSTYLGGSGDDRAFRIAVDTAGSAYVVGDTNSTNFPVANAAQRANGGSADAFVAKLNPSGSKLVYSTYLGGSGIDGGTAIAVDAAGSAYVAGFTASTNFPVANPIQATFGGSYDGFVARLSTSGSALDYSTYLGGNGVDSAFGVASDSAGSVYVMGVTASTNFPVANAFQKTNAGGTADLFIAKISSGPALTDAMISGKNLLVFGSGFDAGAKILLSGEQQKTRNDDVNPTGALFGKKVGKKITPDETVTLQVRNSDGALSNELRFTRP